MKKLSHYELLDCYEEFSWEDIWKIYPMLSTQDIILYYYLSKNYYTGEGNIVDGGVLGGGTTACISKGLIENKKYNKDKNLLLIFDLFKDNVNSINITFLQKHFNRDLFRYEDNFVDFEEVFHNNVEQYKQSVNMIVHKGDLIDYDKYHYLNPIEILSIDIAKTPELMLHICHVFFPHLIPGKSLVIMQDWIDIHFPFIHIAMNLFNEYFEDYYECPNGLTKVFLCTKKITKDDVKRIVGQKVEDYYYYSLSNIKLINMSIKSAVSTHNKVTSEGVLAKFYLDMGKTKTAEFHFIDTIVKYDLSMDFIMSEPFIDIYHYFKDIIIYYPQVYSRLKRQNSPPYLKTQQEDLQSEA